MKRSFFQAAVISILLYGCTTWTLTKRLEKKLEGNYTRMLRAILNKSWRQHPTRHLLYGHLPPITKTIQVRWTSHAGQCWRSRDELISDVLLWTPTYGRAKAGRPARTYIQQLCENLALKTCQRRWTMGKSGERRPGISVLVARHDDDDNLIVPTLIFEIQHVSHSGGSSVKINCTLIPLHVCIYLTTPPWAGCDIRSIFKWSKAGLNSEFSLSKTGC